MYMKLSSSYYKNYDIDDKGRFVYNHRLVKTLDDLDYLDTKSYDIHYIEFDFTNNWNIKEEMNQFLNLTTNSLVERDELIKKLLDVAGINESDKNKLISS